MANDLVDSAAQSIELGPELQAFSITPATVLQNVDETGGMRVQVRLAWLPGVEPWVRVGVLMAGPSCGTFFIPQEGDEVLVAYNQGDVRDAYVIGSVWNDVDAPPTTDPDDAVSKRLICTPKGLQLRFDDDASSITLTIKPAQRAKQGPQSVSAVKGAQKKGGDQQKKDVVPVITIDKKRITIKRATGTNQDEEEQVVTLHEKGITIEAKKGDLVLKAKKGSVKIEAQSVEVKSTAKTEIKADGNCVIKGSLVKIN